MLNLLNSKNCLTAWRDACNYIINNGDGYNLIIEIEDPLNFVDSNLHQIYATGLMSKRELSDVTNTIFPVRLYRNLSQASLQTFYDTHESIYIRGKTMFPKNKTRWGNYFLRFTKFGLERINQLQKIINDINSRQKTYASCYFMHVSSVDLDSNTKPIGNPCLQYVQFAQENGRISLTAIYRNHDFLNKALGNYIGLSRLLEFVCTQTNSNIGSLTCHSIHYYLQKKRSVKNGINTFTW